MGLRLPTQRDTQEQLKSLLDAGLITLEEFTAKGGVAQPPKTALMTRTNLMDTITGTLNPTKTVGSLGSKVAAGQAILPPVAPVVAPAAVAPASISTAAPAAVSVPSTPVATQPSEAPFKSLESSGIKKIDRAVSDIDKIHKRELNLTIKADPQLTAQRDELTRDYADLLQKTEDIKQSNMAKYEKDKLITGIAKVAEFLGQSITGYMAAVKGIQTGRDMSQIQMGKANWNEEYDNLRKDLDQKMGVIDQGFKASAAGIAAQGETLTGKEKLRNENEQMRIKGEMTAREEALTKAYADQASGEKAQIAGIQGQADVQKNVYDQAMANIRQGMANQDSAANRRAAAASSQESKSAEVFDKKVSKMTDSLAKLGSSDKKVREIGYASFSQDLADVGINGQDALEVLELAPKGGWIFKDKVPSQQEVDVINQMGAVAKQKAEAIRRRASTPVARVKLSAARKLLPGKSDAEVEAAVNAQGFTLIPE